ncbi:protein FAM221B-like isoform X2 [Apostichopus japonicus]|uniref:protein FAM221B-like isoform X2 n=1 Tax=Stichopus japonicus TaxID=307972 RepID=UPI003AB649D0
MEERFTKKNVRPKTKAPRSLGSDHAKHKSLKHTNVPRTSTNKAMVQKKQALAKGSSVEQIVTPIGNYTVKPIIPAEKPELLSVAKAMHREDMGSKLQTLFQPELNAAIEAIQTGIYVGWRCPEFTWDCIRLGRMSRCFCGHLLDQHASYNGKTTRLPCQTTVCPCRAFQFIPGRVEDIGEFWHQKRRDFDPLTWRAKCRCNHTHEDHECKTSLKRCKYPGCGCSAFISNFLCAACDQHWEKHETVFEIEEERKKHGIPYGEAYLPFEEMPNLRNMVLTGDETEPGPMYKAITNGRGPIPQGRAITQDTPVRMPKQNGLKPFWN